VNAKQKKKQKKHKQRSAISETVSFSVNYRKKCNSAHNLLISHLHVKLQTDVKNVKHFCLFSVQWSLSQHSHKHTQMHYVFNLC